MGQRELSSVFWTSQGKTHSGRKPTFLPGIGCPRTRASMLGGEALSTTTDSESALDLIDTSTLPGRLLVLWMIFVRVTSAHGKSGVVGQPQRRVDLWRPCRSGA